MGETCIAGRVVRLAGKLGDGLLPGLRGRRGHESQVVDDEQPRRVPRAGHRLEPACNVPGADQRHRRIEAIADLFGAGESEEDIAREMEVPVEAVRECVRWAAEHPDGLER